MKNILIISVHPDDETLGCGGTILRHLAEGDAVHWLILTEANQAAGFPAEALQRQRGTIRAVADAYPFSSVRQAAFPTTKLDTVPMGEIIEEISSVMHEHAPDTVFLPFFNDPHSDHRQAFNAAYSCTKAFRYPSLRRVLMMETPSETDYSAAWSGGAFAPTVFVNITDFLDKKKSILSLYSSEISQHPFPRSLDGVEALAVVRGAACACRYAESFMLLKEVL